MNGRLLTGVFLILDPSEQSSPGRSWTPPLEPYKKDPSSPSGGRHQAPPPSEKEGEREIGAEEEKPKRKKRERDRERGSFAGGLRQSR